MNLYSDLHLDISGCKVVSPCIIAGDIAGTPEVIGDIGQVYSIAGNHDYWEDHVQNSLVGIELDNEAVKLPDGRTMFAGTMWTEWSWPTSVGAIPKLEKDPSRKQIVDYQDKVFQFIHGYQTAINLVRRSGKANFQLPESSFDGAIREGYRYMNDYRYGRMKYDYNVMLNQFWTLHEYKNFMTRLNLACQANEGDWEHMDDDGKPTSLLGENISNHMLVVSHHCPVSREVILRHYSAQRYDQYPQLYPAYYSPAISRQLMNNYRFNQAIRDHGMTWCYGHTHEAVDLLIYPFDNVKPNDPRFYRDFYNADSFMEAKDNELEWRVEVNTNPEYKDIPGVIRLVSNPRGYSNKEDVGQYNTEYSGVKV